MTYRDQALRPRAIELMKAGRPADAIHVQFVNEGADPEEVRAVLTELVALQHEAAARDPVRLRNEAQWMFLRGASTEDVVAHFVRVGIAEEHARPEAARVLAIVQKMKPCQRCGKPTNAADLVFDLSGFTICKGCHLQDEIGRSEARGMAADLEAVGAFGGLAVAMTMSVVQSGLEAQANNLGHTHRPFCAACRTPSGVHVHVIDPATRARLDPSASFVCGQCGRKIA